MNFDLGNLDNNRKALANNDNVARLRLISNGPEPWNIALMDVDTKKIVPIRDDFAIRVEEDVTYLEAKILIWDALLSEPDVICAFGNEVFPADETVYWLTIDLDSALGKELIEAGIKIDKHRTKVQVKNLGVYTTPHGTKRVELEIRTSAS